MVQEETATLPVRVSSDIKYVTCGGMAGRGLLGRKLLNAWFKLYKRKVCLSITRV
jgi:hypothetical protein